MGLVRSLWLVTTVMVAGPATLVGLLHIADGQFPEGILFIGLALVFVVVSEYAYRHFVDRTVGRLKRLRTVGRDRESGE